MARYITLAIALALPVLLAGQQPGGMTRKFFPDPDVVIPTPSFQKKRGYASRDETVAWIRQAIDGRPEASLQHAGKTRGGRDIPAVIIRRANGRTKARVLFTARVHGDEPAGTEAMAYLVHQLFADPSLDRLLDDIDLAILPFINIDGGEALRRELDDGLDMNRDMTKLHAPETVALNAFATAFAPDVVVDFHEYRPFRNDYARLGSFGACGAADAMLLYSDNLNYPRPVKQLLDEAYLPAIRAALEGHGMTCHQYFTSRREAGEIILNLGGASPRSSSTSFALRGAVSILLEIRGVGIGRTSFTRRVVASYLVALEVLRATSDRVEALRDAIAAATAARDDIVVTTTRPLSRRPLPFIDIEKNERVEIVMPTRDAADARPAITRPRPVAYALLPSIAGLAGKLNLLGIATRVLAQEEACRGEVYTIREYRLGETPFEGIREQFVTTEVISRDLLLPAGTVIVPMDQRAAPLAAMLLEPEADNSFTRFSLLPARAGEELPLFRITESITR
jgi:hypothetical protein